MYFELYEEMPSLDNHHFSFNRILLLAIGLWPYEQSKFSRCQFVFFSSILMSAIVFQLTAFFTSRCTAEFVLKVSSTTLVYSACLIKYISLGVNIESMKELLNQFQHIYDELKDKNEIFIANKYDYNVKRFTIVLTIISMAGMFFIAVTMLYWSDMLNVILQINISQSHNLPVITEYFVDQEKYFFFILLHLNIVTFITVYVILAIGTIFIAIYYRICSMFKIASYRIKYSMKINAQSIVNETLISKRIICGIDIHRRAMKLCIFMVSRFNVMYCCLIMFGVIALSLNLFRICEIASFKTDLVEIIIPILVVGALVSYMFAANYIGQDLTDHCKDTYLNAYNIQWYIAPLRVQKFILFILQRGSIDFKVNVGSLFAASLEGFAILAKTSVSYFTVIYSTR